MPTSLRQPLIPYQLGSKSGISDPHLDDELCRPFGPGHAGQSLVSARLERREL